MEVDDAAFEAALIEQFKIQADVEWQPMSAAAHHDGMNKQVVIIDQPDADRFGSEVRTADADVARCFRLQFPDGLGVEFAL